VICETNNRFQKGQAPVAIAFAKASEPLWLAPVSLSKVSPHQHRVAVDLGDHRDAVRVRDHGKAWPPVAVVACDEVDHELSILIPERSVHFEPGLNQSGAQGLVTTTPGPTGALTGCRNLLGAEVTLGHEGRRIPLRVEMSFGREPSLEAWIGLSEVVPPCGTSHGCTERILEAKSSAYALSHVADAGQVTSERPLDFRGDVEAELVEDVGPDWALA
jgi:hypothetical protein